jgi:hypothetical protein
VIPVVEAQKITLKKAQKKAQRIANTIVNHDPALRVLRHDITALRLLRETNLHAAVPL